MDISTEVVEYSSTTLLVKVLDSSAPPPPPVLTSVVMMSSGAGAIATFDSSFVLIDSTLGGTFACSNVLAFTGSSLATCSVQSSTTVRVRFGIGAPLLNMNDLVSAKASSVSPACRTSGCKVIPNTASR